MLTKYRIVRDEYLGFEAQRKRFWEKEFKGLVDVRYGSKCINTFPSEYYAKTFLIKVFKVSKKKKVPLEGFFSNSEKGYFYLVDHDITGLTFTQKKEFKN